MKGIQEFADMAGVSRQAIWKAVKKGTLIETNGKIDENSPQAQAYLNPQLNPRGKPFEGPSVAPPAQQAQRQPDPDAPPPFRSKAELEIHRLQQQIVSLKLRNQEALGHLIPREKVERLIFQPISTAHQRILTDGAKSIAAYVHPMVLGGSTVEDVEAYIRKQISGFIRAAKRQMTKVIQDGDDTGA